MAVDEEAVALARLDDALIRLRRLWHIPPGRHRAAPSGEPVPELSTVLVAESIGRLGDGAHVVRIADVAARLSVAPSTASRLVDRAARAGFVNREADPANPRQAALSLTAAGTALLETSFQFRMDYLSRLLDGWNQRDVHRLAILLGRFADEVHTQGLPTEPAR